MTEPIDDQWTFWEYLRLNKGGSFTITERLRNEIEDAYGPIGWMRDWWDKAYADALAWAEKQVISGDGTGEPLGILNLAPETEEQRITSELVPLVRAAAAEVPLPERFDVLGGHLREFRTVDDAQIAHVSSTWWAHENARWQQAEEDAFAAYLNEVLAGPFAGLWPTAGEPPSPPSPEEFRADMLAAFNKMLGPALVPAWRRPRTEPIKLTREQIDRIPHAEPDEFLPWNPMATWIAGVPVIEVGAVEESTLHVEGALLTLAQIAKGALRDAAGNPRWHKVPLHMTHLQLERVMALTGTERPDDWEETLDRGGKVSSICTRDVFLADRAEDSTPCIERWMDL